MACQFPKGSFSDDPLRTFFLVFYLYCPLSVHRLTAFLIPNDRSFSSFTFLTTLSILFSNSKIISYLSYQSLLLILILLLISGDIHPNPGPIDPCSVDPVESTGEIDWYNLPTVLSGCASLALVSHLQIFEKFLEDTLELVQCAHLSLKLLPPLLKLSPYPHLQTPEKLKSSHL